MNLLYLPPVHDWPAGWHLQPHHGPRPQCCAHHAVKPGHRIYLTGEPGEVFCTLHAPDEKVAELARAMDRLPTNGIMGRRRRIA